MPSSNQRKAMLAAVLLAATAVGVAVAVKRFRETKAQATTTAANIQGQLDELDPVARAATLGKLAKDAVTG